MPSRADIKWGPEAAAHLLRRAGFGGTPEDGEVLAAAGLDGAVDRLLTDDARGLPSPPRTDPAEHARRRDFRRARRDDVAMDRREAGAFERQTREIFDALRSWWLERMRAGGSGVREKLTLFWHGHFSGHVFDR